jgi:hypothetical protein
MQNSKSTYEYYNSRKNEAVLGQVVVNLPPCKHALCSKIFPGHGLNHSLKNFVLKYFTDIQKHRGCLALVHYSQPFFNHLTYNNNCILVEGVSKPVPTLSKD